MVEKLAYSMNCDTSTKNLIHLQADGCAGLIPLRCCALMGLRWGTFARFRALYALNWVRVHAALRRKTPSRFLGYALLAGLESMRGKQKREGLRASRVHVQGWVIRGSNPGPWD